MATNGNDYASNQKELGTNVYFLAVSLEIGRIGQNPETIDCSHIIVQGNQDEKIEIKIYDDKNKVSYQ